MTRALFIQMYTILTITKPADDSHAETLFTAGSTGKGSPWSFYRVLCSLQITTGSSIHANHGTGMHPGNLRCTDKVSDSKE